MYACIDIPRHVQTDVDISRHIYIYIYIDIYIYIYIYVYIYIYIYICIAYIIHMCILGTEYYKVVTSKGI